MLRRACLAVVAAAPPLAPDEEAEPVDVRRDAGRLAGRGRGVEVAGLARALSLSRCTLPITALRVTPWPSSPAIWLALNPSIQSFFKSSTRSSVQLIDRS